MGSIERRILLGAILLMSLLYAAANFRGLENVSGFYGNAYQAIHPESFPVDPFMDPGRPTMQSLYYSFVRLFGELWLDDRFTIFIYWGLVLFGLAAVDKAAVLFGARSLPERLGVLSLMVLGHSIGLGSIAELVNPLQFNPTTMAAPVGLWILSLILAGARHRVVLPWLILLWLISMKNAWMVTFIWMVAFFRESVPPKRKPLVVAGVVLFLAAAFCVYRTILRPDVLADVRLWDMMARELDIEEANPFLSPLRANLTFFALCLLGLFLSRQEGAFWKRVGAVAWAGIIVWAGSGLYLSYAPDLLKVPYVSPPNFARGLWWPQYVFFCAAGVFTLKRIEKSSAWGGILPPVALLLALYLTPFRIKRFVSLALLLPLLYLVNLFRTRKVLLDAHGWLRVVGLSLTFTTLSSLSSAALSQKPHLLFLVQHGILGDNPSSKWVGVNEYIREHTSPSSVILALSTRDYYWRPERLLYDESFRTRTGRSMPLGHRFVFYFDYEKLLWANRRIQLIGEDLIHSWKAHDLSGVLKVLDAIGYPDYVVVPTVEQEWIAQGHPWPYTVEAAVGKFTIFRKGDTRVSRG